MKISMNWLADYLPGPLEADGAAEALTHGGFPVESIEALDGDTVLDVEVTSNRGDCLSHLGIARELSALLGRPFQEPAISAPEAADSIQSLASVTIESPELCPHYTARLLRDVKIGPSPQWMVRRLEAVGLRAINNVVDVTNYVLLEMGQPLHAFDFDRLDGRRIIVRAARPGEMLTSLDGHQRALTPGMLVIADATRPVALAGVMGGLETEVTESSRAILLESARFDPLSIRQTARSLAMASDSSYRFERGIDPTLPQRASLRAAQLILQTAGGELLSGQATAGQSGYHPRTLKLRLSRLKQVLGVELPPDRVLEALSRLRLSPVLQTDHITVTVPSWRLDVNLEIDLVEEVARVIGYDAIPVRDEISIRLTPPDPRRRTLELIRSALVAAGYYEAVTFSFVSDALAEDFMPAEAKTLARADARVRSADAHLRPSILPGLLEAVRRNEHAGTAGAKLFEIGSTFWHDENGRMDERRRLSLVGSSDLRELRGVIEDLLGQLDDTRSVHILPDQRKGLAKGAAGRIEWGGKPIGFLGKIDKEVADKLSLRTAPAGAELELDALLEGAQHVPQLRPLPRFPAVRRDLSLIVPERLPYERIESLVRQLKPAAMEDLEYVTTYRGKPLEKGTKSVTITLVFRSPTQTLTSEAVEDAVAKVVAAAQEQLNATLRV